MKLDKPQARSLREIELAVLEEGREWTRQRWSRNSKSKTGAAHLHLTHYKFRVSLLAISQGSSKFERTKPVEIEYG